MDDFEKMMEAEGAKPAKDDFIVIVAANIFPFTLPILQEQTHIRIMFCIHVLTVKGTIVGYYTLKKCRSPNRYPKFTADIQQKGAIWQETTGLTVPLQETVI